MANIEQARRKLTDRILGNSGLASHPQRVGAFHNAGLTGAVAALINKVAMESWKVTDEDIAAAEAEGLDEEQLFELIVCAAAGQATREYETALAALHEALKQE